MTPAEIAPYILALVALLTAVNGLRQTASKSDHKLIEEQGKLITTQGKRIDVLEARLLERDEKLDTLERQNTEKTYRIERLTEQVSMRDEKIAALEVWAKQLVAERDGQIETLRDELDKANARIRLLEAEVARLSRPGNNRKR